MNGVQLAGSTWLMPRAMNRPTTASLMTTMISLTRELWVMPFMLIKVMIQMMAIAGRLMRPPSSGAVMNSFGKANPRLVRILPK